MQVHVLCFIFFKENTHFAPSAYFVPGRIVKTQENLLSPTLFSRGSKITSCCSSFCILMWLLGNGENDPLNVLWLNVNV